MKKSLAKKITLSILAGALLMSNGVAWAEEGIYSGKIGVTANNSIYLGVVDITTDNDQVAEGHAPSTGSAPNGYAIAIGDSAKVSDGAENSIAIGGKAFVSASADNSIAIGAGSVVNDANTVSVGGGSGDFPQYRYISNVADVNLNYPELFGNYAVNVNTLNQAISNAQLENSSITELVVGKDIENNDNPVTINDEGITVGEHSTRMDGTGFYVWDDNTSGHILDEAIASIKNDGSIKGANGAFIVNESGNVTAQDVTANNFIIKGANSSDINIGTKLGELDSKVQTNTTTIATKADRSYVDNELGKKANAADVYTKTEIDSELGKKADQSALDAEKTAREQADQDLQSQIDNIGGGAIAGINQRLDKTNAKINKVGAGAAALAALHPLEYDPDDKLTFSAGMGNYAGENAAALGAFYRPNEKFMVSLGGTMGNGENMVNLGLSIGLDKPNGYAKLSKRELIQEVNAVKAENNMLVQKVDAVEAELAEMKALIQAIMAKK